MIKRLDRLFICGYLVIANFTVSLCASEESCLFQTMPADVTYMEKWAEIILKLHGIDVALDCHTPLYVNEVESPKWIRGITLIIAGLIMLKYSKKWGVRLIKTGLGYLGIEYYDYVWDYLENKFGIHIDEGLKQELSN